MPRRDQIIDALLNTLGLLAALIGIAISCDGMLVLLGLVDPPEMQYVAGTALTTTGFVTVWFLFHD